MTTACFAHMCCGLLHRREGCHYTDAESARWLSDCLGRPVTLTRSNPPCLPTDFLSTRGLSLARSPDGLLTLHPPADRTQKAVSLDGSEGLAAETGMTCTKTRAGFSNTGDFLAVLSGSVDELNERLPPGSPHVPVSRFRPNLVLSGGSAAIEHALESVSIDGQVMSVVGQCPRCEMVNLDQDTGAGGSEPLRTLGAYRRDAGKILFGVLLSHRAGESPRPHTLRRGAMVSLGVPGEDHATAE